MTKPNPEGGKTLKALGAALSTSALQMAHKISDVQRANLRGDDKAEQAGLADLALMNFEQAQAFARMSYNDLTGARDTALRAIGQEPPTRKDTTS